jgi:hypothetical protein
MLLSDSFGNRCPLIQEPASHVGKCFIISRWRFCKLCYSNCFSSLWPCWGVFGAVLRAKSELFYDRRSIGQSVLVSGHHLGPATNFSFTFMEIIFKQLGGCYYGAPSLTRGWNCNLQLLLGLASAIFFGTESAGFMTKFYSQFWDIPTWRARFLCLFPPGTGWPSYTPGHWIPFFRLLLLVGLQCRYANPPPHRVSTIMPCWEYYAQVKAGRSEITFVNVGGN